MHRLRKRSVPPVPSSVPLTADEKQTLIGFHRRQFVGHHRKGRSLRRASTTASNSVARFGVLHLTSSDELGGVKNPASCATFMRPGVLNRLVSTNSVSPGPQAAKRSWTRAWPPSWKRAERGKHLIVCVVSRLVCHAGPSGFGLQTWSSVIRTSEKILPGSPVCVALGTGDVVEDKSHLSRSFTYLTS